VGVVLLQIFHIYLDCLRGGLGVFLFQNFIPTTMCNDK